MARERHTPDEREQISISYEHDRVVFEGDSGGRIESDTWIDADSIR